MKLCTAWHVNLTDDSSVGGADDLLGARGQLDSGLLGLWVVGDDGGVVPGGAGQLAPVSWLLLQGAHDGTLRHGSHGENVADIQLG